jgi:hypothetical protein
MMNIFSPPFIRKLSLWCKSASVYIPILHTWIICITTASFRVSQNKILYCVIIIIPFYLKYLLYYFHCHKYILFSSFLLDETICSNLHLQLDWVVYGLDLFKKNILMILLSSKLYLRVSSCSNIFFYHQRQVLIGKQNLKNLTTSKSVI